MNKRLFFQWIGIALVGLAFASCNEDDDKNPDPHHDHGTELITTVVLTFSDTEGALPEQTFTWSDTDGLGGNAPSIDIINLQAPALYNVAIALLDESNPNDVHDLTHEIEEEGAEHQFFFIAAGAANDVLTFTYNDSDENGHPIGLNSRWAISGPAEGTVRIVLRHGPDKSAEGVADGNIDNAAGETDVDIIFDFIAH